MTRRTVFYVIRASAEENQSGCHRYSKPYFSRIEAIQTARKSTDDFVGVEQHTETWDYTRGWQIDHNFNIEQVDF